MRIYYLLSTGAGFSLRDPLWLVKDHDYCARLGPTSYIPRADNKNASLDSVQVVFRHGARTEHQRSTCFPDDKRANYACNVQTGFNLVPLLEGKLSISAPMIKLYGAGAEDCSLGQLLDVGLDQARRLAQYLANAYPQLKYENIDRITTYSTDTQRTMGTLSTVLSELFEELDKPLRVHTREFDEDLFALNIPSCPFFANLRATFRQSDVYKATLESDAFKACSTIWQARYQTPLNLKFADDCLLSAYCADAPLPGDLQMDPHVFKCVMDISFQLRREKLGSDPSSPYYANGTNLCSVGSFLVFEEFKKSIHRNNIASLYAIHDETFVCLLNSLGLWDGRWPKYAEAMAFEFYSDGKIRIVRDGQVLALIDKLETQTIKTHEQWLETCNQL